MPTVNDICEAIYNTQIKTTTGEIKKAFFFKHMILTSGKLSLCYVDHRILTSNPEASNIIISGLVDEVSKTDADHIVSSADAGIYWGAAVAQSLGYSFCSMRKDGGFCGAIPEGTRVVGVDDLNTTLGTVLKLVDEVRNANGDIDRVIVNIDRQEYLPDLEQRFRDYNVKLIGVVNLMNLIDYGVKHDLIGQEKLALVKRYRNNPNDYALQIIREDPQWFISHDRVEKAKEFYKNNHDIARVIEEVLML